MTIQSYVKWQVALVLLSLGFVFTPHYAFAGSIFVSVSPGTINSLDSFDLMMTSSGVTSCLWSRLDNGTVWAWQNQPIPGGPSATVYDSGTLSGWAGPATYEWFFECADGVGGTYSASAFISISAPVSVPVPAISLFPSSLSFADTYLGNNRDRTIQVVNVGDPGSFLSGNASMISGTDFSCVLGCTYTNIPYWGTHIVTIRFSPTVAAGPKYGTVYFTGGGDAVATTYGNALAVPPPPAPTVIVNPPSGSVPDVGSWNVDMIPNGSVVACEYSRASIAYGGFPVAPLPASTFTTGVQNWSGPGVVTYTFRCVDAIGQWSPSASGTVTIGAPIVPTGSISGDNSCIVSPGGTSCSASISWITNNPQVSVSYIYRDDVSPAVFSTLSGGPVNTTISYALSSNVRVFTLMHNGVSLATKSITAICSAGESWVSGVCTPNPTTPIISVSPLGILNFYGVTIGDTLTQNFIVTNVGAPSSLLSGSVLVTGTNFTCVGGCSYTNLANGDTQYVQIKFTPTGIAGPRSAQVQFSGGGGATRYANGTALSISPTGSLDFGNVKVNTTKTLALVVTNPSNSINLGTGTFQTSAPFTCVSQCTYSLGPNETHTFLIGFTPTVTGPKTKVGTLSGVVGSLYTLTGAGVIPTFRFREQ